MRVIFSSLVPVSLLFFRRLPGISLKGYTIIYCPNPVWMGSCFQLRNLYFRNNTVVSNLVHTSSGSQALVPKARGLERDCQFEGSAFKSYNLLWEPGHQSASCGLYADNLMWIMTWNKYWETSTLFYFTRPLVIIVVFFAVAPTNAERL